MCNGNKNKEDKQQNNPTAKENEKPTIKPGRIINEDGKAIEDRQGGEN